MLINTKWQNILKNFFKFNLITCLIINCSFYEIIMISSPHPRRIINFLYLLHILGLKQAAPRVHNINNKINFNSSYYSLVKRNAFEKHLNHSQYNSRRWYKMKFQFRCSFAIWLHGAVSDKKQVISISY